MIDHPPIDRTCDQYHEVVATLQGQPVRLVAKPGPTGWRELSPATTLLADAVNLPVAARVLLIGCEGALAVALARRASHGVLWLVDPSYLALTLAQQMFAANAISNARVCFDPLRVPDKPDPFDYVVLQAPPDRALARRWLATAHAALRPEGQLYVAGANGEGIRSIIEDAEALFGNKELLDYRRRHRVARATKRNATDAGPPAWLSEPGIAQGTWHRFDLTVRDTMFHLHSLPGVFAHDRLDAGTALLLAHLDVPRQGRILDVGCGLGIIGLVAARLGATHVDLIDVNLLAIAAARKNIAANGVVHARVLPSDLYGAVAEERYDLIVSNPPFHVGKTVDYTVAEALIAQAPEHLTPDGRLVLVANAFVRYEHSLRGVFRKVDCLAATKQYQVLSATGASPRRSAVRSPRLPASQHGRRSRHGAGFSRGAPHRAR